MRPALPARGLLALATASASARRKPPRPAGSWPATNNARVLHELAARYSPESATYYGLEGYEEQILDLSRDRYEEHQADTRQAVATLGQRLDAEQDPRVRQDLEILIASAQRGARSRSLDRKYFLPYYDPASTVFGVARGMLSSIRRRIIAIQCNGISKCCPNLFIAANFRGTLRHFFLLNKYGIGFGYFTTNHDKNQPIYISDYPYCEITCNPCRSLRCIWF